ncbi:MAG: hypothetical protein RLO06_18455 [Parvibaculum sp.]
MATNSDVLEQIFVEHLAIIHRADVSDLKSCSEQDATKLEPGVTAAMP